jgi:hypothetical protein
MKRRPIQYVRIVIFSVILLVSFIARATAGDFVVTSVIRNFPMTSGDPVYRDFYINAGKNNGLKNGVKLEAIRKIAAFDNVNNRIMGDTKVPIAKLKVIHVDETVSIARLLEYNSKEKAPLAGAEGVMVGDLVQVAE